MSPCCVRVGIPVDGPVALHVDDHRRDLGVVGEADELAHERDAGAGRGGEGARAVPRRADHHPDRRQLVLGLHDAVVVLAGLGILAVLRAELLERVHHAGGRRDRVPGRHRRAGVDAAERGRRVAVDQDPVVGGVHLLEANRQRAVEVLDREVVPGAQRLVVRVAQRLLLGELLLEQLVDDAHVDVEQRHQRPQVGDVLHQDPLARIVEDLVAQPGQRHAQEGDVGARQRARRAASSSRRAARRPSGPP